MAAELMYTDLGKNQSNLRQCNRLQIFINVLCYNIIMDSRQLRNVENV